MTIKPREYFVNFSTVTDRATLHDKLRGCLALPPYYGANLDALHDCLTSMGPAVITLSGLRWLEPLGSYGALVLRVFREAAEESPSLTLIEND